MIRVDGMHSRTLVIFGCAKAWKIRIFGDAWEEEGVGSGGIDGTVWGGAMVGIGGIDGTVWGGAMVGIGGIGGAVWGGAIVVIVRIVLGRQMLRSCTRRVRNTSEIFVSFATRK